MPMAADTEPLKISKGHAFMQSLLWSTAWTIPLAMLTALLYRFPLPFSGYESGWNAAIMAPLALIFYIAIGGFVFLLVLGSAAGLLAYWRAGGEYSKTRHLAKMYAMVVGLIFVAGLAVLDKLIGPW